MVYVLHPYMVVRECIVLCMCITESIPGPFTKVDLLLWICCFLIHCNPVRSPFVRVGLRMAQVVC